MGETFPIGFGRYQLIDRLAMGGMAELFLATSPGEHGFQKKVVIKRLLPHLLRDETYKEMFIDEAKLTARLVHPKIAQTFELGKVGEALYIAMELVDGIDVLALLREFATRRRRIEPQIAAWIAHEVLDALDYAHNLEDESGASLGIVHRDISPSNVLLSTRGDVKLVDFGIARAIDPDRAHKSKSGTLKGKYGYMSPEQVIELPLDGRSDVFSVGVVLAELLTGRRLFAAANELDVLLMVRDAKLSRLDKYGIDIDPDLNAIVRKALKKPLDERYSSAAAFREALAEWLFEHRHRVTNKHIAEIVGHLKSAVDERRAKGAADGPGPEPVAPRAPSEGLDSVPIAPMDDADVSMPVISVSYEAEQADPPQVPVSTQPTVVLSTASGTPAVASGTAPSADTPSAPPIAIPKPPPGALRKPTVITVPPVNATSSAKGTPIAAIPLKRAVRDDSAAAPQLVSADTISAAVVAIVLPEPSGVVAGPSQVSDPSPTDPVPELRQPFDDLTEEPAWVRSRDIKLPSPDELSRKAPPAPPSLSDIPEPPDDAGDFATTSPLRVLFRLMTARATGLLVVAAGGIKKELYVRDGQPEYVSSNVASELFGNYLVTKGVLSDGELAMALAMMPHYGGKLGDTLVGLGLLKPLEVFRHLTRQVRTKIIDVCTWNKGSFAWYAGRENPREAFPLDFNAFEILGAGAMAFTEASVDAWLARNAGVKLRAARTRRVGPERFEVKGLSALFESLDGTSDVGALVAKEPTRDDQLRTARMLCLLVACDLARPA